MTLKKLFYILLSSLGFKPMQILGLFMATQGIRYFRGDPYLSRWITSLGPGTWFAPFFIFAGFFSLIIPIYIIFMRMYRKNYSKEGELILEFKSMNLDPNDYPIYLAVEILLTVFLVASVLFFEIDLLNLFWSKV